MQNRNVGERKKYFVQERGKVKKKSRNAGTKDAMAHRNTHPSLDSTSKNQTPTSLVKQQLKHQSTKQYTNQKQRVICRVPAEWNRFTNLDGLRVKNNTRNLPMVLEDRCGSSTVK